MNYMEKKEIKDLQAASVVADSDSFLVNTGAGLRRLPFSSFPTATEERKGLMTSPDKRYLTRRVLSTSFGDSGDTCLTLYFNTNNASSRLVYFHQMGSPSLAVLSVARNVGSSQAPYSLKVTFIQRGIINESNTTFKLFWRDEKFIVEISAEAKTFRWCILRVDNPDLYIERVERNALPTYDPASDTHLVECDMVTNYASDNLETLKNNLGVGRVEFELAPGANFNTGIGNDCIIFKINNRATGGTALFVYDTQVSIVFDKLNEFSVNDSNVANKICVFKPSTNTFITVKNNTGSSMKFFASYSAPFKQVQVAAAPKVARGGEVSDIQNITTNQDTASIQVYSVGELSLLYLELKRQHEELLQRVSDLENKI